MKMPRISKRLLAIVPAALLVLSGCGTTGTTSKAAITANTSSIALSSTDGLAALDALREVSETSVPDGDAYTTAVTMENASPEAVMAENDKPHAGSDDAEVDTTQAIEITLNGQSASVAEEAAGVSVSEGLVTITSAGTYSLSGDFSGQVRIEAGDEDKVILILNGVNITNSADAAIRVTSADEVTVYLAEGTSSSLSDADSYAEDADGPAAALAASTDLTIAGDGTLEVSGNGNDGISSSDGLVILGGTIKVSAADDAIRGKDYVVIAAGTLELTAGGDGVKTANEEDAGRGYVLITGGALSVSAESDTIDAISDLIVSGGNIVSSKTNEGLEAFNILLAGGSANITSSDDGINAAGDGSGTPWLVISGGEWTLTPSGDGIDSNGSSLLSGGTVLVWGPTNGGNGALDNAQGLTITGGTLFTADRGDMLEPPLSASDQATVVFSGGQVSAGSEVSVVDSDGNTLDTFTVPISASAFMYSSTQVTSGQSYTLKSGDNEIASATAGDYQDTPVQGAFGPGGGGEGEAGPGGGSGGPGGAGGRGGRGLENNGTPPTDLPSQGSQSGNSQGAVTG